MDGITNDSHPLHGGDGDTTPGTPEDGRVLSPSPQGNGVKRRDATGLRLIAEAWASRLDVRLDGERLVIRGPRSAEAVALRLLTHKAEVVAVLKGNASRVPNVADWDWLGRGDQPDGACWGPGGMPRQDEPMPGVVAVGDAPTFPGDDAPAAACLECGSLELWWDALGGVHCQRCDRAGFERSRRLAERAERLRGQRPSKKSRTGT